MTVKINDKEFSLDDGTKLSYAIERSGKSTSGIAVAVNGKVVKSSDISNYSLADGDNVLIIKAFYGG